MTSTANRPTMRRANTDVHFRATEIEVRAKGDNESALPAGVCGRVTGIALVYEQIDSYQTVFSRGCLSRTIAERVAARKVKLFADHEMYVNEHVGTVVSITDVGDSAVMVADLFDTPAGRTMKEYLTAVLASRSDTGLSVGFRPVSKVWQEVDTERGKAMILRFNEIELKHIGVTPVPAVEGSGVTGVRSEGEENGAGNGETDAEAADLLKRSLSAILRALPEHDARAVFDTVYARSTAPTDTAAAPPAPPAAGTPNAGESAGSVAGAATTTVATEADRADALRRSFAVAPNAP